MSGLWAAPSLCGTRLTAPEPAAVLCLPREGGRLAQPTPCRADLRAVMPSPSGEVWPCLASRLTFPSLLASGPPRGQCRDDRGLQGQVGSQEAPLVGC